MRLLSCFTALSKCPAHGAGSKPSLLQFWGGLILQVQREAPAPTFPLSVFAPFCFATEPSAAAGFSSEASGTHQDPASSGWAAAAAFAEAFFSAACSWRPVVLMYEMGPAILGPVTAAPPTCSRSVLSQCACNPWSGRMSWAKPSLGLQLLLPRPTCAAQPVHNSLPACLLLMGGAARCGYVAV